jgi:hypothetical protein
MPSRETIKKITYKVYNYSFFQLKEMLLTLAASVSLTMDLWISHNQQGYFGITCIYIS